MTHLVVSFTTTADTDVDYVTIMGYEYNSACGLVVTAPLLQSVMHARYSYINLHSLDGIGRVLYAFRQCGVDRVFHPCFRQRHHWW